MDIESLLIQVRKNLSKVIDYLEEQLWWLQVWKANAKLLENIEVYIPAWQSETKISNIANITNMDSQTLRIEPREKSQLSSICKWITVANIWLNPQEMWDYIMIKVPPLTTERRKDLTKIVAKYWEEAKISIRNIRHENINDVKKTFENKEISENDKIIFEKKIDELTKEYNNIIDQEISKKSEEILKI